MKLSLFRTPFFRDADIADSVMELEKVRDDLSELLQRLTRENKDLRDQIDQLTVNQLAEEPAKQSKFNEPEVRLKNVASDQVESLHKEIDLYKQENKLILDNMFLTQEELERQLIEKEQIKLNNQLLLDRLLRFNQHYPRNLDFLSIELQSFDAVSNMPNVIWLIRDCHLAGLTFSQINFKVVLNAGMVGIEILSAEYDSAKTMKKFGLVYPGSIMSESTAKTQLSQLETSEQWLAHKVAIMSLKYVLDNGWKNISIPDEFDANFWVGSFLKLVKEFDALPPVFRFNEVQLRQESINPDYEHLWLEVSGITFGDVSISKLEVRVGAANIKLEGFSRFPKLEIPLVDGAVKPFDSWYAESFDDYGAKYELRFDLDKKRFDVNVWSRLTLSDRNLIYGLIGSLPKLLAIVAKKNKSLRRPIKTWFDFAVETKKVLYDYLKATVKS